MMNANSFDVNLFIDCVKNNPVIWDLFNSEYYDKIKKRNAWFDVASIMYGGFEDKTEKEQSDLGSKLIKRWKGLRDSFLKSEKKSSKVANSRKYIYSRQLEFLLNTTKSSPTVSSVDGEEGDPETPNVRDAETQTSSNVIVIPQESEDVKKQKNTLNKQGVRVSDVYQNQAAKRRAIIDTNFLNFMNTIMTNTNDKTAQEIDDDKAFFESLLPAVKTFPLEEKIDFRCEVMTLLKTMGAANSTGNVTSTNSSQRTVRSVATSPQTQRPTQLQELTENILYITHTTGSPLQRHYQSPLCTAQYISSSEAAASPRHNENSNKQYSWLQSPSSHHPSYTTPQQEHRKNYIDLDL